MSVITTLAPVFAIIALGVLLRRTRFMDEKLVGGMNRLTFWVALPALLFHDIVVSRPKSGFFGHPFDVMIAVMLLAILAGYLLAGACGVKRDSAGTFAQAAYRGNLAFIGLPVLVFGAQLGDARAVAVAVYLMASVIPFYNIAAVLVLTTRRERPGLGTLRRLAVQLATNPLILSCTAGAIWSVAGPDFPKWFDLTLDALGKMALPLALLGIGATLHLERMRGEFPAIAVAAALKVVACPLAGWLLARWLGLSGSETRAVLILLATPAATQTFVMADQLGGDRALAASTVAVSTIASFIPLAVILAYFP